VKRSGSDPTAAVVFDVFGTLLDVTASVEPARAALGGDAERLGELWRRKQLELSWLRSLMGAYRNFDALTADALGWAMAAMRVAEPGLAEVLLEGWRRLPAHADAAATLDGLRGCGAGLAPLSTGTEATVRTALDKAGLLGRLGLAPSFEPAGIFEPAAEVDRLANAAPEHAASRIGFFTADPRDAHAGAWGRSRSLDVDRSGPTDEPAPGCPASRFGALAELLMLWLR
jgi:2-haloacid dehalogenase